MPLKPEAALRKDRNTAATLEHRHFATIATILACFEADTTTHGKLVEHFAQELATTNPRFDSERFRRACDPDA